MIKVEAKIWLVTLTYWLRLLYLSEGLPSLILREDNHVGWLKEIKRKIALLGLSLSELTFLGFEQARLIVKQRVLDIKRQNDLNNIIETYIKEDVRYYTPAPYLSQLKCFPTEGHLRWLALIQYLQQ